MDLAFHCIVSNIWPNVPTTAKIAWLNSSTHLWKIVRGKFKHGGCMGTDGRVCDIVVADASSTVTI